ncbi:DUF4251 domain-containing protein [uncultured Winogradskyella sp.]|uniref:DUF4251 domain-containing protein n=1 Tax=uncultured Winogradskyella sp. TaxID=395353 RepID=UPI00262BDFB0|nr:DUF4251 domain-containing protein [uncultured Winogradskyella sp.]
MKKLILLAFIFSLSATTYVSAQTKQSQKEVFAPIYQNSKSIVKSESFLYVGNMVLEDRTREKLSDDSNQLVISDSKMSGELVSIKSKNKTINVSGDISDYNVNFNDDKQEISISFSVKSASETVSVNIEVKPSGNAFLTASSGNDTLIYWTGKIKNKD